MKSSPPAIAVERFHLDAKTYQYGNQSSLKKLFSATQPGLTALLPHRLSLALSPHNKTRWVH